MESEKPFATDDAKKAAKALFEFLQKPLRNVFGRAWFNEEKFYLLVVDIKKALPHTINMSHPIVPVLDGIELVVQNGFHVLGEVGIDMRQMNDKLQSLRQVLEMDVPQVPLESQNPSP